MVSKRPLFAKVVTMPVCKNYNFLFNPPYSQINWGLQNWKNIGLLNPKPFQKSPPFLRGHKSRTSPAFCPLKLIAETPQLPYFPKAPLRSFL